MSHIFHNMLTVSCFNASRQFELTLSFGKMGILALGSSVRHASEQKWYNRAEDWRKKSHWVSKEGAVKYPKPKTKRSTRNQPYHAIMLLFKAVNWNHILDLPKLWYPTYFAHDCFISELRDKKIVVQNLAEGRELGGKKNMTVTQIQSSLVKHVCTVYDMFINQCLSLSNTSNAMGTKIYQNQAIGETLKLYIADDQYYHISSAYMSGGRNQRERDLSQTHPSCRWLVKARVPITKTFEFYEVFRSQLSAVKLSLLSKKRWPRQQFLSKQILSAQSLCTF